MFKNSICTQNHKTIPTWLFTLLLVLWITDSNANVNWAQDWEGKLEVAPKVQLTLILHVTQNGESFNASLDSVDQGALGIPASQTHIDQNQISVKFPSIGASYTAKYSNNTLDGTFSQAGQNFPLILKPISNALKQKVAQANLRPQEPKGPFPYTEEAVTYPHLNQDFNFAGTLTKPKGKGPFTAAILISGSGPQDRDAQMLNHKPFKVLADHLTRLGYAVLRTDDRGTGQSGGHFYQADLNDFSYDIESAFEYLKSRKDINSHKIGLIGHSEGGITAPMFAARQPKVAFVISLAGVAVPGNQLWATQQRDIGLAAGMQNGQDIYDLQLKAANMSAKGATAAQLKQLFSSIPNANQGLVDALANMLSSRWGKSFMSHQPHVFLSKLTMPILAINGDLDIQVKADDNLNSFKEIMAKTPNNDVTISKLPGLNHLFQQAKTGNTNEYGLINETMNAQALDTIGNWLIKRF